MVTKTILLATFINSEKLEITLKYLLEAFEITKEEVFVFKNLDDVNKLILTFKLNLYDGVKLDLRRFKTKTIPIHKRGTAIYTINALNKLIIRDHSLEIGNIEYKNFKINWDKYQDSLILSNNGELIIYGIKRVF